MWWRFHIDVEGYERHIHMARNSHVIGFQGWGASSAITAGDIQKRLQAQACQAADLTATPPRQAAIIRDVWRCSRPFA